MDVVIGWDADPSIKEGTTPDTNSLLTVAKDLFNIELNFMWMVPNDQYSDRLAMQLSSGDIPDIVMLDSAYFYEFLDSDYLRDLTDAYDTYASDQLKSATGSCTAFPPCLTPLKALRACTTALTGWKAAAPQCPPMWTR